VREGKAARSAATLTGSEGENEPEGSAS